MRTKYPVTEEIDAVISSAYAKRLVHGVTLPALEALGKLTDKSLAKLKAAFDGKKAATVVLAEPEQFTACYWKSDDGSAYLDSMKV